MTIQAAINVAMSVACGEVVTNMRRISQKILDKTAALMSKVFAMTLLL